MRSVPGQGYAFPGERWGRKEGGSSGSGRFFHIQGSPHNRFVFLHPSGIQDLTIGPNPSPGASRAVQDTSRFDATRAPNKGL